MRAKTIRYFPILMSILTLPTSGAALQVKLKPYIDYPIASEEPIALEETLVQSDCVEEIQPEEICCKPDPRWYLDFKAGYTYFTDESMREFFDKGGFSGRVEIGYKVRRPLYVWLDGGYFQKKGKAIGGGERIDLKLATITLGFKTVFFLADSFSFYLGAGPRVFMLMMHNDSPFVRGDDNAIGVGGGFTSGFWILPFSNKNIFFDLFGDYSWKTLKIEADEISSTDSDINVSGLTAGLGLGFRF